MKKQSAPAQSGPDAGPWVDLGNGRSRSASTGKMRYDPNADPAYRDAIKRIQAQEQAAAAKRALDALAAAPDPGYLAEGVQVGAIYSYSMVSPAQKQCGFSMIKRVWVDGKLISEEIE